MGDAVQKRLLLPFGLAAGGVGDDGQFDGAAAQPFDDPDAFHPHHIHVQDAGAGESVHEQRLGLLDPEAVDDAVLLRIQAGANLFREIRMSETKPKWFSSVPQQTANCWPASFPQFSPEGQWKLAGPNEFFAHDAGQTINRRKSAFSTVFVQQRLLQKIRLVRRRLRAFGLERQAEGEGRAVAGPAFGVNLPAVMMDDEKAGHQIDAVFGRHAAAHHERVEHDAQAPPAAGPARCR